MIKHASKDSVVNKDNMLKAGDSKHSTNIGDPMDRGRAIKKRGSIYIGPLFFIKIDLP
jgi:hypothetical protein